MTVGSGMCAFHGENCRGRLQWHHVVPRQRIKRAWRSAAEACRRGGPPAWSRTRAIADERNRVWLCVFHHGQVEQRKLYVTPSDEVREFAREYGLLGELEADVARGSGYRDDSEAAA